MLILGLLLAVAALVVFGYMLFGTQDLSPLQIDLGVFTVELTPMHLYLLGAATLVVLVLGLLFLTMGLRAQRRRRREVKELRAAVRDGGTDTGRTGRREAPPVEQRHSDPVPSSPTSEDRPRPGGSDPGSAHPGSAPYERDVPDNRGAESPSSPPRDPGPDVALPGDYPRDDTTPGTHRP
ncbi:hypothetical protein [Ornithinimicrobium faecis]|uniref:hypothetical protein n=1 Tax=Ornithinimicrobium faecis TaxID=2934158 RepID=UPI00211766CB|nr:hypothetical protein [Ornithinimicrobium sp. HY1745]